VERQNAQYAIQYVGLLLRIHSKDVCSAA
jgi:hypothetical protein